MQNTREPDSPDEEQALADQPSFAAQRRMTVYQTREGRPRWMLHMQAVFWRVLMNLGMFFHRMAPPRPPKPNFSRTIPAKVSGRPGQITLNFYVPRDYQTQRRLWTTRQEQEEMAAATDGALEEVETGSGDASSGELPSKDKNKLSKFSTMSTIGEFGDVIRRRSTSARKWGGYPVVINFHGGGFTLGNSFDDARWCGTVVNECNAIVVSVDYRLAPEHPFPTAVEDGVDSVIYLHQNAESLGIDRNKIALSGFSSGGNMCFTVPIRLYDEMQGWPRDDLNSRPATSNNTNHGKASVFADGSPSSSTTRVAQPQTSETATQDHASSTPSPNKPLKQQNTSEAITEYQSNVPNDIKIACLIPWYPPVDYTRTREQRRATCRRADQELPALFTDLFDESYLHPPHTINLDSPYLSPGVAPTSLLKSALPKEIIMHTCEWDMLLDEGEVFKDRLNSPELGKHVWYKMVEGVPHGWDKAPNPWKPTPGVKEYYLKACKEMRRVFGPERGNVRPPVERATTKGWPTMAPRGSVSVVR